MEDKKIEETKELIKPSFDIEIKAEIKGVAKIEDNIGKVKDIALAMKEYYSQVEFNSEDDVKVAVEEKKKINKFKEEVSTYRKDIIEEYKKPITSFETTAKETEAILTEVYQIINKPVDEYREKEKEKLKEQTRKYFNEYLISKNIDFVTYENANINVTLSSSLKSLKEQATSYIDKIVDDLNLIDMEEYKTEILVEYKQNNFNVSSAIMTVKSRMKAIEEAKKQQEIREQIQKEQVKEVEKIEVLIKPKIIEEVKEEEEITTTFTVTATKEKLLELRKILDDGGYKYE